MRYISFIVSDKMYLKNDKKQLKNKLDINDISNL